MKVGMSKTVGGFSGSHEKPLAAVLLGRMLRALMMNTKTDRMPTLWDSLNIGWKLSKFICDLFHM